MRSIIWIIIWSLCLHTPLQAQMNDSLMRMRALYFRLPRNSIEKQMAFYHLYPKSEEGQIALKNALSLLQLPTQQEGISEKNIELSSQVISGFIQLLYPFKESQEQLPSSPPFPFEIGSQLAHKKLPGYHVHTLEEVLKLKDEEIDVARGLFLASQLPPEEISRLESLLDLMALQVLAALPPDPTIEDKINAINQLIYFDIGFRYPPLAESIELVDRYSFLSSVMDYRQGICLGTSLLILCIAQRIDLPLEVITPPGHIYLRFHDKNLNKIINIETTARGINLPTDHYMSLDTISLQERSYKQTIGISFINQALLFFQKKSYDKVFTSLKTAELFLPHDAQIYGLLGLAHYIQGDLIQAHKNLALSLEIPDAYRVSEDLLSQDVLRGTASPQSVAAVFMFTPPQWDYLKAKQELLEKQLVECPQFRAGWFQLAMSWLQLKRPKESLAILETLYQTVPDDLRICYYLSVLYFQRGRLEESYHFLLKSETIAKNHGIHPIALEDLRKELISSYHPPLLKTP